MYPMMSADHCSRVAKEFNPLISKCGEGKTPLSSIDGKVGGKFFVCSGKRGEMCEGHPLCTSLGSSVTCVPFHFCAKTCLHEARAIPCSHSITLGPSSWVLRITLTSACFCDLHSSPFHCITFAYLTGARPQSSVPSCLSYASAWHPTLPMAAIPSG